jgi:hypothetical protein
MNTFIGQSVNKRGHILLFTRQIVTKALKRTIKDFNAARLEPLHPLPPRNAQHAYAPQAIHSIGTFCSGPRFPLGLIQRNQLFQVQNDHACKIHGCGRSSSNRGACE